MKIAQSMNTYPTLACVKEGQTSEPFTHAHSSMLVKDWQLLEGLLGTKYPTTQVLNFPGHFNFALCMKWACIQVNVDLLALALLNLLTLPTLTLYIKTRPRSPWHVGSLRAFTIGPETQFSIQY